MQRPDGTASVAVAIGDHVLDLGALQRAGLLDVPGLGAGAMLQRNLNTFMADGPPAWRAVRRRASELLRVGEHRLADDTPLRDRALVHRESIEMLLPFEVGDYVDFFSSLHHAANLGRILRPGGEPLARSWRHLPVAYHGRASSVVVSATPVRRPHGLVLGAHGTPELRPTRMLDFELEVGFVVGA